MKRNVVLVLDADADTARAVASAAAGVNSDVRFVRTSNDFFHFCQDDFENVAVIILDVDPGVDTMALLEAMDACESTAPIIVVSALEEHRLRSVLQQHGAIACLEKPLSFVQLRHAVEEALTIAAAAAPRCDVWGHVTHCGCSCPRKNALLESVARN
jgi:FixJ family two-component response regulator